MEHTQEHLLHELCLQKGQNQVKFVSSAAFLQLRVSSLQLIVLCRSSSHSIHINVDTDMLNSQLCIPPLESAATKNPMNAFITKEGGEEKGGGAVQQQQCPACLKRRFAFSTGVCLLTPLDGADPSSLP